MLYSGAGGLLLLLRHRYSEMGIIVSDEAEIKLVFLKFFKMKLSGSKSVVTSRLVSLQQHCYNWMGVVVAALWVLIHQ